MIPAQFVLGGDAGITLKSTFSSIDGYKPKNKKLFCFPYHYLALTNCAGTEAQYKFEYFDTPTNIHFTIDYAYNMSASCNAHPDNYKGMEDNWDEGIVLTNFPVCSWTGNVYANWLALNKMQISNAQIGAIGSTALGAIGGSVLGGIGGLLGAVGGAVSGISKITDIMAQQFQRSLVPYQVQGQIKCAVSNVKWHRVGYQLKVYGIKAGYAKLLDDYFTMFGYKINRLKVPNIRGRKSWNYVKTIDVNIVGSLPVDNMINIKNAFNRGITFWHGDFIGDYTRDNSIGVATGTTPPQLTGAQTSANGWVVTLTFDKYMNNPANKQSEFVLKINDVESPLAYIQYNSDFRKYDLGLLNNAIVDTDTVTISYIQGTITADDNSALGSFTNYPVNNIAPELIVNRDNIYNYLASHTHAGIVAITNDDIDTFLDNALTLNKSIKAFYLQKAYSTGTLGIKVVLIMAYDRDSTLVWSDNNPIDYVNSLLSAHAVIVSVVK
jgi:hypothetical protein